jgi:thiosulfate/3-mercaptopyruvate sulfurtransferase
MHTTLTDVDTLHRHLDDPDWCIVDCRFSLTDTEQGRRAYAASHLPGARYAHLDEDLSGPVVRGVTGRHPLPAVDRMAATLSRWGIDGTVQVVAYDDAGGSVAARLWWILRWLGHEAVAVLDGGWNAWLDAGLPVTAASARWHARAFTPGVRPHLLTDADHVQTLRTDPGCLLIDARAPARYRGEHEPIDPVAGHIPGARSAPFNDNLTPEGRMRTPEELRARFAELFGPVPVHRVVSYCGSGVTACHNLLAIAHAGLGDAVLYAGSWSEWIADPNRPVAKG